MERVEATRDSIAVNNVAEFSSVIEEDNNVHGTDEHTSSADARRHHRVVDALNPVLAAMKYSGTFFDSSAAGWRWRAVYPIVVCVLLWVHFAMLFVWYGGDEVKTPEAIAVMGAIHSWCFQHCAVSVICIAFSRIMPRFVSAWALSYGDGENSYPYQRLQRCSWFLLVVSTSVVIQAQVLVALWQQTSGVSHSDVPTLVTSFYGDYSPPIVLLITYHVILIFTVSCSLYPFSIFVTFCFAFYQEFRILTNNLRKIARETEVDFESVETVRRRHIDVCRLVGRVNSCFKYHTLIQIGTGIPALCFTSYELHSGWWTMPYGFRIGLALVVCLQVVQVLVVTSAAAVVNHVATLPVRILHEVKFEEIHQPALVSTQILLFLNHVTRGEIGFSCGGLFYITKHTLTLIIIALFSYGILLMKFGHTMKAASMIGLHGNSTTESHFNTTETTYLID